MGPWPRLLTGFLGDSELEGLGYSLGNSNSEDSQVLPQNSGPAAPLARYSISLSSGDLLPLHLPTRWVLPLPSPATNLLTPPGRPSDNSNQRSTSHKAAHNLLLTLLSSFLSHSFLPVSSALFTLPPSPCLLSIRHSTFPERSPCGLCTGCPMCQECPSPYPDPTHSSCSWSEAVSLPPPKTPSFCFPLTVGLSTCPGCPSMPSAQIVSGYREGHTEHLQTHVSLHAASPCQEHSAWHREGAHRASCR